MESWRAGELESWRAGAMENISVDLWALAVNRGSGKPRSLGGARRGAQCMERCFEAAKKH